MYFSAPFLKVKNDQITQKNDLKISHVYGITTKNNMGSQVIAVKDFDINKVSFGEIKKISDKGGKYIPLYYDKSPFVIQTPQCYAPFGMNCFRDDKDGTESYSLELSFKEKESRPSLKRYYEILEQIDQKVLEAALDNSQLWLRKSKSREVVDALFTKTIRVPTDRDTGAVIDKWPPTFRLKLNKDNKGHFRCVTYDQETKDEISLDSIMPRMKGSKVTAIASCGGIWVAGGKFGCSWKATQLMVVNTGLNRFAFQDIVEDQIQSSSKDVDMEGDEDEIVAEVSNEVETSDDEVEIEEDEVDEDEEDEPEPVKIKKKRATKSRA